MIADAFLVGWAVLVLLGSPGPSTVAIIGVAALLFVAARTAMRVYRIGHHHHRRPGPTGRHYHVLRRTVRRGLSHWR